jgi:hypothetical protein
LIALVTLLAPLTNKWRRVCEDTSPLRAHAIESLSGPRDEFRLAALQNLVFSSEKTRRKPGFPCIGGAVWEAAVYSGRKGVCWNIPAWDEQYGVSTT